MKCETCKYWSMRTPPAIGECKYHSKFTLFKDTCENHVKNADYDFLNNFKNIFQGFDVKTK